MLQSILHQENEWATLKYNRKYSDEKIAWFMERLVGNNGNIAKTARDCNVPVSSLQVIVARTPIIHKIIAAKKQNFVNKSWNVIFVALRELKVLKNVPSDRVRALKDLIATLYEKQSHALMEPTERVEKLSLTKHVSEQTKKIYKEFEESNSTEEEKQLSVETSSKPTSGRRTTLTIRERTKPATEEAP